jgi:hypothetical protein
MELVTEVTEEKLNNKIVKIGTSKVDDTPTKWRVSALHAFRGSH